MTPTPAGPPPSSTARARPFRLLPLLAVLLSAPLLRAQDPPVTIEIPEASAEEKADIVREFRRYFRRFKTAAERVEAVRTLERAESVDAARELVDLFDHKQPEVQKTALDVFGGYRDPATFQPFVDELPEMKDQRRRALLIEVLGRAGIKSALPSIQAIALEDKAADDEVRFRAARAIGMLGDESCADALGALVADRNGLVRMAACDAVGTLRIKALGPQLVPLLDDSAWQVQVAAVQAIARVREPAAVEPLIALMRKGGRLEEECADALFRITAMDFGRDADAWQQSWTRLMAIPGWRIPTDEELAKKAEARKRYDALYGIQDDTTSFGGIKTSSTKLLFIIDVSGSMEDLVVQREKFEGGGYRDFEKLTIVKSELERTIDALGPDVLFNIVAFAADLDEWKRYLAPSNVVNKSSAKAWVRKLKPIGGSEAQSLASAGLGGTANLAAGKTNTFAALMYPFGVDPESDKQPDGKAALANKVDTVFFLSDGRPTTGKLVDTRKILDEVAALNQEYKIVFHTIAIGEFQKNFLQALAEHNGGVFVDLGY